LNGIDQSDNPLWCEKYRPTKIADCILPKQIQDMFSSYVAQGKMPNLLLTGTPGTGKTTAALALCSQLQYEVLFINGSSEGKLIDTLRVKIAGFASTVSLYSDRKCVIMDEADGMPVDTQKAYRSFIEQYSSTCSFISTANYKNRLIDALHSRSGTIEFKIQPEEASSVALKFFQRACFILDDNNIKYEKAVVATFIKKHFPDWRRVINELQLYSVNGQIDSGILVANDNDAKPLLKYLKEKDFAACKKWAFSTPNIDMAQLCRELDTGLYDMLQPKSIPASILIYSDYQHKAVTSIDPALNVLAMLVNLMFEMEWK